jgi:hypothetical protein
MRKYIIFWFQMESSKKMTGKLLKFHHSSEPASVISSFGDVVKKRGCVLREGFNCKMLRNSAWGRIHDSVEPMY